MERIVRFVECTIPISNCNLHCSYCYVIQENRRNTKVNAFRCSAKEIGEAFAAERWGGLMLVNMCAFGETLFCKELPDIVHYILKQGHYINITNNGTVSKAIDQILYRSEGMHSHLCFAFSLHYIELKKRGLLRTFVDNVNKVRKAGCSFLIQLNLADEYIECLDEIKEFCSQSFNGLPQIALTRREGNDFQIFTAHSEKAYFSYGRRFDSPLFDFTCENFKVKRNEFCYAGKWTFKLDLATGDLRSCYFSAPYYNIYENPRQKIKTLTVGNNCGNRYCVNSSHFMSLGVIPEIKCPTYVELRDRDGQWYSPAMRAFLNQKLYENNRQYMGLGRLLINLRFKYRDKNVKRILSRIKRAIKKRITG